VQPPPFDPTPHSPRQHNTGLTSPSQLLNRSEVTLNALDIPSVRWRAETSTTLAPSTSRQPSPLAASQILPACPHTASVFQHADTNPTHAPRPPSQTADAQHETDQPTNLSPLAKPTTPRASTLAGKFSAGPTIVRVRWPALLACLCGLVVSSLEVRCHHMDRTSCEATSRLRRQSTRRLLEPRREPNTACVPTYCVSISTRRPQSGTRDLPSRPTTASARQHATIDQAARRDLERLSASWRASREESTTKISFSEYETVMFGKRGTPEFCSLVTSCFTSNAAPAASFRI
jgi:hypothetical protein